MGYYYPKAAVKKDFSPMQMERYNTLRTSAKDLLPAALQERLQAIKEYVGPIYSGDIWSAREELLQDAFAAWVLAGEDPDKVTWVELEPKAPPPPTEAQQLKVKEWLDGINNRAEERRHPIRTFLRKKLPYLFGS